MKTYKCDLTYVTFLVLGICSLLSYFALMSTISYWKLMYDAIFVTIISVLFCFSLLCGTVVLIKFNTRFKPEKIITPALCGCFLSLILIVLMYFIPVYAVRYYLTLLPVALCGFASGIYFGSIGACAARISPLMYQATSMGLTVSALFIQIVKDVLHAFFQVPPTDPNYQVDQFYTIVLFFGIAVVYIIISIVVWEAKRAKLVGMGPNETVLVDVEANAQTEPQTEPQAQSQEQEQVSSINTLGAVPANKPDSVLVSAKVESESESTKSEQNQRKSKERSKLQIFKVVLPSVASQFIQYFSTYFCYPSLITTTYLHELAGKITMGWWALVIMTIFFFFNALGSVLPRFQTIYKRVSKTAVLWLGYVRLVFIPLYLLLTLPKGTPIIRSDAASIIIGTFFGFSNGFVSTFLFMKYQEDLSKVERVTGSFFIALSYQIAQVIGSLCGVGLATVVK